MDKHIELAKTFLESLKDYEWKDTSEYTRLVQQLETFIKYSMRPSWKD